MPKRSIRSPSQFTAPGALRKTPPRLAHSGEGGDHALPQRQLAHGQGLVDGEDVGPAGKQADLRALGVGGRGDGQRPGWSRRPRMRDWGRTYGVRGHRDRRRGERAAPQLEVGGVPLGGGGPLLRGRLKSRFALRTWFEIIDIDAAVAASYGRNSVHGQSPELHDRRLNDFCTAQPGWRLKSRDHTDLTSMSERHIRHAVLPESRPPAGSEPHDACQEGIDRAALPAAPGSRGRSRAPCPLPTNRTRPWTPARPRLVCRSDVAFPARSPDASSTAGCHAVVVQRQQ